MRYPTPQSRFKKNLAAPRFSTCCFSVFGYLDEKLFSCFIYYLKIWNIVNKTTKCYMKLATIAFRLPEIYPTNTAASYHSWIGMRGSDEKQLYSKAS